MPFRNSLGMVRVCIPSQFQYLQATDYMTSESVHHYHSIKSYFASGTELFESWDQNMLVDFFSRSLWLLAGRKT